MNLKGHKRVQDRKKHSPNPADSFKGCLNVGLIAAMMLCVAIILVEAVRKWTGPVARNPLPSGRAAEA